MMRALVLALTTNGAHHRGSQPLAHLDCGKTYAAYRGVNE